MDINNVPRSFRRTNYEPHQSQLKNIDLSLKSNRVHGMINSIQSTNNVPIEHKKSQTNEFQKTKIIYKDSSSPHVTIGYVPKPKQ